VKLLTHQKSRLEHAAYELQHVPGWDELTPEEHGNAVASLDGLLIEVTQDLTGLKKLLARDYDIGSTIDQLEANIQAKGEERRRQRQVEGVVEKAKLVRSVDVPVKVTAVDGLDSLIGQLTDVRSQVGELREFEITFFIKKDE
jgi:hypothetical protein